MITVLRSSFRSLARRRVLTLFQVLGVACGVAAVVGMVLASRAAMGSFTEAVRFLQGRSTHTLMRPVGFLDEAILRQIMIDPGVAVFAPVIDQRLELADGSSARVLGLDPFLDGEVRQGLFRPAGGGLEERDSGFLDFLLEDDMVILEARLADRLGVSSGERVDTERGSFKVAGTFTHPAAEPLILMDISHAQEHFDMRGSLDRIDLVLKQPETFVSMWSAAGYQVISQGEQRAVYEDMLRAFRLNIQALSLLALLVGVFLVYNTSMFSVISRRRDVGVLRSLGATRAEIVTAVTAEVTFLGIVGGAAGGGLGYALAHVLTGVVGDTISRLYFFLRPLPPEWSWSIPLAGSLLGLLAALLGGAYPLSMAARQDPVAALRGRVAESGQERYAVRAALVGLLMVLVSSVLLALPGPIYQGYVGVFGLLLGLSFLCGLILVTLAPLFKTALRFLAGPVGSLAAGNVRRNLGRTAVAVAAFGIALSLTVGLGSMIGSFRQTLIWWMDGQIRGDIYVRPPTGRTIPAELYGALDRLPGVWGVDPYRNVPLAFRDSLIRLSAIDPEVLGEFTRFSWFAGDDSAWERVERGEVIVSESFFRRFRLGRGDEVVLAGHEGQVTFTIAGIFYDYTTEHGLIMMSRDRYLEVFRDAGIDSLAVFLNPGDPRREETTGEIRRLARTAGVNAMERERFHEGILSVFDATFAVTRSMRALAIVVAFFGIAGALLSLFMERRREFGIYRALGLTGQEVALMTLLEGLSMGIAGFLFGSVAGTALTLILIRVINLQSFNWTIFFHPAAGPYAVAAGIALLASIGAAIYPMARIVRTYPHLQIREE
ncbi:MAG: FtsX-like permease family protein [bacterium]|nr:MAG: FtsX-like permease family protein [bacterium]